MSKEPHPLAEAERIAQAVIADLAPYCERIEVAGSVRRRKVEVGDLELVAIPRWEQSEGLFSDIAINTLWRHLNQDPHYLFRKGNHEQGRYYQLQLAQGWQLDLFLATPANWGLIYMIRTGAAEFSAAMLARWKKSQDIGPEQQGSVDGRLVTRHGDVMATPEEADVFAAVGVAPVAPEHRTDGSVLRAVR